MMKKVWLILLAVVFVFGFSLLGCSDDGGGGDDDGPLEITNPTFLGWGGLGSAGSQSNYDFLMDTSAQYDCRITYTFPATAVNYANITMYYTLTRDGGGTNPMKITIKDSLADNWGSTTGDEYKQSDTNGSMTYTALVSKFTTKNLTIAHNKDGSANFKIKITKIVFSD
jgi:hypothetical protein